MSMFTKKHYIWFATKIGDGTFDCSDESLVALLKEFKLDNPKFDSTAFIRAGLRKAYNEERVQTLLNLGSAGMRYNEEQDHEINLKGEML